MSRATGCSVIWSKILGVSVRMLWMNWTFESVKWEKQIALPTMETWMGLMDQLETWIKQKGWSRGKSSCLTDFSLFLPLDSNWSSALLGFQACQYPEWNISHQYPWLSSWPTNGHGTFQAPPSCEPGLYNKSLYLVL